MDKYTEEKIEARKKLNSLPPQEAQARVNRILDAENLKPDLSKEIDWGEIPIPTNWQKKDG